MRWCGSGRRNSGLAAKPVALADPLSFTNTTIANGLGDDVVGGVYSSGSTIYAATDGGLSIAQQSDPTPSAAVISWTAAGPSSSPC